MCCNLCFYITSSIFAIVAKVSYAFGIDGRLVMGIGRRLAKGTLAMTLFTIGLFSIFITAFTLTAIALFGLYIKFTPALDISRNLNVSYQSNKYTSQVLFMPEEKVVLS